MKDFSRGVGYYTKGKVEIGFPEDDVCCNWCPMLGSELKTDRPYCRRTGEYLVAPKFMVGSMCPVKFEDDEKENT